MMNAAEPVRGGSPAPREAFMAPLLAGGLPEVPAGARLRLTIENAGEEALNVAVIDLAPDWSIEQVHPPRDVAPWETLEPGGMLAIELDAYLPAGLAEGVDVLKTIAATGPFDLVSLERPALGAPQEAVRGGSRRGTAPTATDPFGRLLAALAAERGPDRVVRSGETAPESWTAGEVEVRVVGEGEREREPDEASIHPSREERAFAECCKRT